MSETTTDTIIDLLRHGEPQGGRAYRGHGIDDPLSEKGWQQMRDAVGEHSPWDHIVSSPMLRCQAFAEELHQRHAIPFTVDQRLQEVGFGCWEGRTPEQIKAEAPQEYTDFYRDPVNCRPPGAEPLDEFISRVTQAYEEISQEYIDKHILLVAHAGVIRAIIAHALHAEPIGLYRIKVNNAGISRIRHGEQGGMLEFHNSSL